MILPVELINPLVKILPPVILPLADTTVPNKLDPVTVPVALINPAVRKLPPMILPVELINPLVKILPPVTLPLTLATPVMYSPVVANTATFDVPPTPTVTLPPELTTVTFDVPELILATLVITPVKDEPLPKM